MQFHISGISSQRFGLGSLLRYVLSVQSQKAANLSQFLSGKFCPLHKYSNEIVTAGVIWPDCRMETNAFCWARHLGVEGVGLRPLACWDCGFEARLRYESLLLWVLCVVGQRSLTDRDASLWVMEKPYQWGGHEPALGHSATGGGGEVGWENE
jgi:hypothetical protein